MAPAKDKKNKAVAAEVLESAAAISRTTGKFALVCDRAGGPTEFINWLIELRTQESPVPYKVIANEIEQQFDVHVAVGTLWDWVQRLGLEDVLRSADGDGNG